jgi:hypothetical protein
VPTVPFRHGRGTISGLASAVLGSGLGITVRSLPRCLGATKTARGVTQSNRLGAGYIRQSPEPLPHRAGRARR